MLNKYICFSLSFLLFSSYKDADVLSSRFSSELSQVMLQYFPVNLRQVLLSLP